MEYGPWDAVGRARRYLIESLVWHLFLVLFWCRRRSSADYDMEEGGQALPRVGGGAAAPVQQPSVKFLLQLPSHLLSFNLARAYTHTH